MNSTDIVLFPSKRREVDIPPCGYLSYQESNSRTLVPQPGNRHDHLVFCLSEADHLQLHKAIDLAG